MTEDTAWRIAGALESLAGSAEKFAASLARMAEDMTLVREMLQEDRRKAAAKEPYEAARAARRASRTDYPN